MTALTPAMNIALFDYFVYGIIARWYMITNKDEAGAYAELAAAVGRDLPDEESVIEAAQELLAELSAEGVLVTRGELGMILVEKDGAVHVIPVSDKSEVYDVSGAGDTCVATVILALAAGISPEKATELSNIASGIAVRKLGTATVSVEELRRAVER